MAKAYKLSCCGVLTEWNVKIEAKGTIHLQIWKGSGTSYDLVYSDTYTFSTGIVVFVRTCKLLLPAVNIALFRLYNKKICSYARPSPYVRRVFLYNDEMFNEQSLN